MPSRRQFLSQAAATSASFAAASTLQAQAQLADAPPRIIDAHCHAGKGMNYGKNDPLSDPWTTFNDPQFDRLMEQALAANPTLAQAMARVREAQSLSDLTRAGLVPSLSFNAQETRQRFSAHDVIPPPYAGTDRWQGREGLDLSWDIDFWGRQASLLAQARSRAAAAALDLAGARLALSGAVALRLQA